MNKKAILGLAGLGIAAYLLYQYFAEAKPPEEEYAKIKDVSVS